MNTVRIDRVIIPELLSRPDMRLGRHVKHDSRSLMFRIPKPDRPATSVYWPRHTPILNQGDTGSCTGNATVGALGTEPFYNTLMPLVKKGLDLDESEAITIYSLATQLDDFQGTYPPDDTGSNGLSAAKAAQKEGLISGYLHALSLTDLINGLQRSPMIVGTNWHEGMDEPNDSGLVRATGSVRGGHEYECQGVDLEKKLFFFVNSWGSSWGVRGGFCYSFDDMEKLLSEQGDATLFVPLTEPTPAPTPTDNTIDARFIAAMDAWVKTVHSTHTLAGKAKQAYEAYKAWKQAQ